MQKFSFILMHALRDITHRPKQSHSIIKNRKCHCLSVALFMAKRCLVKFNWLLCLHVLSFLLIDCRDNDYRCSSWARIGECQRNPRYMRLNCKRSCRLCGNYNSKWQWSLTFDQLACSSRDIRLSRSTIGEHFAQPLCYSFADLLASIF